MYKEHFGLDDLPFSISPDPRYLYMSGQHREALAHLMYGITSDGGFVLLTGEVGTGKTTISRCLLDQLPPNADIAFILNPKMTVEELLAALCDELHIAYPDGNRSVKVFVDRINDFLLANHAKGRRTVLILEEAQNLMPDVLEQIRLLTNLETNERKLLQIIMLGQPELRDMLSRKELRQLSQRITARYHLGALSPEEVDQYVTHRLTIAGVSQRIFPSAAIRRIWKLSGGIPRKINLLCDRALMGAYAQGKERVDVRTVVRAAREVFADSPGNKSFIPVLRLTGAMLLIGLCIASAIVYYSTGSSSASPKRNSADVTIKGQVSVVRQADKFVWPADVSAARDKAAAFQPVFERWGISGLTGRGDICLFARSNGLACLEGLETLSGLIALNRPAVLKLSDGQGQPFYASLISFKDDMATLIIGRQSFTIPRTEVNLRWSGEYTLLWRMPPGDQTEIRPGEKGPAAIWLDEQLGRILHQAGRRGGRHGYDETLTGEVKQFQMAHELLPDGIAGPRTLIRISDAAGSGDPSLKGQRTER